MERKKRRRGRVEERKIKSRRKEDMKREGGRGVEMVV